MKNIEEEKIALERGRNEKIKTTKNNKEWRKKSVGLHIAEV